MSKIVHVGTGNHNEDILQMANLIATAVGENEASEDRKQDLETFKSQFTEAINSESPNWTLKIFKLFIDEAEVVMKSKEKSAFTILKNDTDTGKKPTKTERLEAYFAMLIFLMSTSARSIENLQELAGKLVSVLSSSSEYAELRLRHLMMCYNTVPKTQKTSAISKATLFAILKYAEENGLFLDIVSYLDFMEDWVSGWQLPAEENRETLKELYYIVSQELGKISQNSAAATKFPNAQEKSFAWLRKYLDQETELNDRSLAVIESCVIKVCTIPSLYQVEGFLDTALLQKARAANNRFEKLAGLLQLFVKGSIQDLENYYTANKALFEELKIDIELLRGKLRVLTLCTLCEGRREVPLAEIEKTLGTTNIENDIINASHHNVLTGKIDELRQILTVESVLQRSFQQPQWQKLDGWMVNWLDRIDSLQGLQAA